MRHKVLASSKISVIFTAEAFKYFCLVFRGPYVVNEISIFVIIYEGILTFFVLAMFAHATFRDPGILPRGLGHF